MTKKDFLPLAQTMALQVAGIVLKALLLVAGAAVPLAVAGSALVQLWDWFVLPAIGIPTPTLAQAMGMMLLVTFLRADPRKTSQALRDAEMGETTLKQCVQAVIKDTTLTAMMSAFVLFTGITIRSLPLS